MNPPYWDTSTFIFYYSMGIFCAIMIGLHFGSIRFGINTGELTVAYEKKYDNWRQYFPLLIILIAFASFRKVGPGLGGTDSLSYEQDFLDALKDLKNFEHTDVLFGRYTLFVRYLTSNPFIYRLISYSFIAFTYCYFIKELCPQKVSCVPFILIVWPYICGFSSMRSSMAIGWLLLSLVALYKKQYARVWIFFIVCVLFHRMMFIFTPVLILFNPISNLIVNKNRLVLFLILGVSMVITIILSLVVQKYVILLGMLDNLDSPDASYIKRSLEYNILDSWPMFIQEFLLMALLFISYGKFNSRKAQICLVLSCIDIVITIPALILGIYRISQCLFIPTLVLWGILIYNFNHKFQPNVRPLISFIFLLGFSFIFYKRLDSLYESSSLMPYLFIWQ